MTGAERIEEYMKESWRNQNIFSVRGKKALIPGGTKGLGCAMAECLLENGCDVTLVGRNAVDLSPLQDLARENGSKCLFISADITLPDAAKEVVEKAEERMGRIDILINSAGMNRPKMAEDMDDDTWKQILTLNLDASFFMARESIRVMRKNHYGKIINISSMKGFLGVCDQGYTAYCASKGAINMLTKQLACEVAHDGITVNAIAPTFIKTNINAKQLEDPVFYKSLTDRIPVGRIGEFKDLMGLMLLFASDASQFITGQIVRLDGGISASQ